MVRTEEANCLAFVGTRKAERCFESTRNREPGSRKLMSDDEAIIRDRVSRHGYSEVLTQDTVPAIRNEEPSHRLLFLYLKPQSPVRR